MTLPNFLIIGAAKAGTTSLYNYLEQHPDVYMSPDKEPRFFAFEGDDSGKYPYTSLADYEDLFKSVKNESAIGEASTYYLCSKIAPFCINKYIPHVKIIAVLRHPADRAYSHYIYWKREGKESEKSFSDAISRELNDFSNLDNDSYIMRGMYGEQLSRYYKIFPKENIKVYLFEELVKSPDELCNDVFSFLNVDPGFSVDFSRSYNESTYPGSGLKQFIYAAIVRQNRLQTILVKYLPGWFYWKVVNPFAKFLTRLLRSKNKDKIPPIDNEIRNKLISVFHDDIQVVEKLTGRDLKHWLEEQA